LAHLSDEPVQKAVSDLKRAAEKIMEFSPGTGGRETRVPGLPDPGSEPGSWLATSGGPWVYPERWQADSLAREGGDGTEVTPEIKDVVNAGAEAARRLRDLMKRRGVAAPASYLAVLVQDVDSMGLCLSGRNGDAGGNRISVSAAEHQRISERLQELAGQQRRELRGESLLGVPVYVGGDDLLAFTPAVTALTAAQVCHDVAPRSLPTVSTAVLFFHYHGSLQGAVTRARELLEQAKREVRGKHALAVGYLRRSGTGSASIQPWMAPEGSSAREFAIFAAGAEHRLSPRLLADLDRDADELALLSGNAPHVYQAELARLVRRHTEQGAGGREAAAQAAVALEWLGAHEVSERPPGAVAGSRPQLAARVGVFLRQEAR
jgi:CRISPR-associated protein Cmr2